MREVTIRVTNKTGLHARPASQLVTLARQYQSTVQLVKANITANCSSIVKVLSCNVMQGDEVVLRADGPDEEQALEALAAFISNLEE